ncbi:TPA: AraC family transcriptional regulator, partial [Vibrio alginolyticus]
MSDSDNQKILSYQEIMLPKPAELITLPSYMDCHDHSYTQIVIGLKGQA